MIVTLKEQSKDTLYAYSGVAGIYVLEPNPINDKSHWLHHSGSWAIWYNKEIGIWAIGYQEELGSYLTPIFSALDVSSPQESTAWAYLDGKEFIVSDDFIMVDTFVEAGTCILHNI